MATIGFRSMRVFMQMLLVCCVGGAHAGLPVHAITLAFVGNYQAPERADGAHDFLWPGKTSAIASSISAACCGDASPGESSDRNANQFVVRVSETEHTAPNNLDASGTRGSAPALKADAMAGINANTNSRADATGSDPHRMDKAREVQQANLAACITRLIAVSAVALITILFAREALKILRRMLDDRTDSFYFRRHWGGFGGAVTGWNLSPALIRLIVAAALAAGAVLLGLAVLDAAFSSSSEETSARAGQADAAAASETAPSSPSKR